MNDKTPYARPPMGMDPFRASLMIYIQLLGRCGVKEVSLYDTRAGL